MLILSRRIDESIILFDRDTKQCIRIAVVGSSKGGARIGIQGAEQMQVIREELLLQDTVRPDYREAAKVYQQCYEDIDE